MRLSLPKAVGSRRALVTGNTLFALGLVCMLMPGCVYDWSASRIPPDGAPGCGNGTIEPPEDCDSEELLGETCASLGYASGTLSCADNCAFDTSLCNSNAVCGDGVVAPDEECDDGNTDSDDGCSAQCTIDPGRSCAGEPSVCATGCGNGECDLTGGEDLATCPADCGWVQLSAGDAHTCGVKANGTVWCWGDNAYGQLGDGTLESRITPVQVPELRDVVAVAAGARHSCAIDITGDGYCWGDNEHGQLGDGSNDPSPSPVAVVGLGDAETLSVGERHSCATTGEQRAFCWGNNDQGQLGDGGNASRLTATAVAEGEGLTSARSISAGGRHSCAVRVDDTVWCWGENSQGQLGAGDSTSSNVPRPVDTSLGFSAASMLRTGDRHTCARDTDGVAWCWGEGADRRLGYGNVQDMRSPEPVSELTTVVSLAAGEKHSCAVASDGLGWCWGSGADGRLGSGTTPNSTDPVTVVDATELVAITAGTKHTCAIIIDGSARCWGDNTDGQLGSGEPLSTNVPVLVDDPY